MILAIVAVGKNYIFNAKQYLPKYIENGWDVRLLTDEPQEFPGIKTYEYENKVFSYIDKLLFPLRLVEKLKEPVLYVDADWFQFISDELILNFKPTNEILYWGNWPNGKYFPSIEQEYFEPLINYFKKSGFVSDDLILMIEYLYYFPYIDNISNVIHDLERIKPVLEYQSIIKRTYFYPNIGNGEGVALSYVLHKNNIPTNLFESKYFLEENKESSTKKYQIIESYKREFSF
jgi:hypothetical protein